MFMLLQQQGVFKGPQDKAQALFCSPATSLDPHYDTMAKIFLISPDRSSKYALGDV